MTGKHARIVISGAAGLVGQNLIVELEQQGYTQLVAIAITCLIKYSNLNSIKGPDERITYATYSMPKIHSKWQWSNLQLIDEVVLLSHD